MSRIGKAPIAVPSGVTVTSGGQSTGEGAPRASCRTSYPS